MDLSSGKFTTPRNGIYFFSFALHVQFPISSSNIYLQVGLYLNGGLIGKSLVYESNIVGTQYDALTIQSTLNLKKGDQVWVEIVMISTGVTLHEDSNHVTHFTGYMLQEEIVASL